MSEAGENSMMRWVRIIGALAKTCFVIQRRDRRSGLSSGETVWYLTRSSENGKASSRDTMTERESDRSTPQSRCSGIARAKKDTHCPVGGRMGVNGWVVGTSSSAWYGRAPSRGAEDSARQMVGYRMLHVHRAGVAVGSAASCQVSGAARRRRDAAG